MKRLLGSIIAAMLLLGSSMASADIVVLVHGFNESGKNWYKKGVVYQLGAKGYAHGGHLALYRGGIISPNQAPASDKVVYSVSLPFEESVLTQSELLARLLVRIRQISPAEPFTLVGHSAGGLVARTTLLNHPQLNIARLITIATPHLGAPMAEIGEMIAGTPMGLMADFMGMDEFADSENLFSDLAPLSRNNFLKWLNARPHPPAAYVSIIHTGDKMVSTRSQNMNHIRGIQGRSLVVPIPGGHNLNWRDGAILAALL